jgi:cyanophycinase
MHASRLRPHRSACAAALLLLSAATPLTAQRALPEYGPANGTLLIVGGGALDSTGIIEKFIALAGGPAAKVVVVPTAGGNRRADGTVIAYDEKDALAMWRRAGLSNVHMLHTHDPAVANTDAFIAPLKDAKAVWFVGGRQWNIVDSYAGTRTLDAFRAVLDRGGVIGGTSAGATIQGTYLVRGAVEGSQIMMAPEPNHQDAFNFLRRSAIDQHINTRNRWNDLAPVLQKFPKLLGIGLSEGTAIIVTGDTFEVIGKAQVAVHDNTHPPPADGKMYHTLEAGARYDMKLRTILSAARK